MAKKTNNEVIDRNIKEKEQETVTPVESENNGAETIIPVKNTGAEITETAQNEEKKEETVETTENENLKESTRTEVKNTYISVRKRRWVDLQDNNYPYKQGDPFPREGLEVSEERIKELSTINNKLGEILIQKIENKGE